MLSKFLEYNYQRYFKTQTMKNKLTTLFAYLLVLGELLAQNAGPLVPNNFSSNGSGASWGNLAGVQAIDNNPGYVDLAQFPNCSSFLCYHSNIASLSNFGFNIPLNATITGVQLDITQRVNSPGGGIHDSVLTLALNGIAMGNNKANASNWSDTPQNQSYGSSTDTWGNTLTPADVNNSAFGVLYEITNTSYDQAASVDYLTMTVYYQIGTSIFEQSAKPWNVYFEQNNLVIDSPIKITSNTSISLYNASGQLVFYNSLSASKPYLNEYISLALLQSGIYFIAIESADGSSYKKKLLFMK